jgi:phage FluMu gp28-like protein
MTTKTKAAASADKFFLPYQAKWIQDTSRLKIMEKSRQIGISWSTAYGLVRRKAAKDARLDAWVSSRDDIQARLFLEDCKSFAGILNIGAEDLGEKLIDDKNRISAYVLEMANKLRIHSMSSNPDAQAGKRGDRVLDEFALHPDPRKLYTIAYPGITWGGSLEIVSTHRGTANYFNTIVREIKEKENPKKFSLHRVTLQDALDQGFLAKLQAKLPPDDKRQEMDSAAYFDFIRNGCASVEDFQQEYMCVPLDESSTFLSYDLIAGCEYGAGDVWETNLETAQGPLYIGVDVGRTRDLTVIWVLEEFGGILFTRRVIKMQNAKFAEQEERLWNILRLSNVRRCCIDQTGIGMQFAERAKDRFGYKVEGIQFTGPVKEDLAYPIRASFEEHKVKIPKDVDIRAALLSIKRDTTSAGNARFGSDRGPGGHADEFWGLALARHAAGGKNTTVFPQQNRQSKRARVLARRRDRSAL